MKNNAFTLIEMLVVIAIISILASMLMPSLRSAINTANGVSCQNNLKNIGISLHQYADEFNSFMPAKGNGSVYWFRVLGDLYMDSEWPTSPNIRPLGIWACPSSEQIFRANDFYCSDYGKNPATGESVGSPGTDYAANVWIKITSVKSPSAAFYCVDSMSWASSLSQYTGRDVYSFINSFICPGGAAPRHNGQSSGILYIDGHTSLISPYDSQAFPTSFSVAGGSQSAMLPWSISK